MVLMVQKGEIPGAKQIMVTFFCYCALEQSTALWASSYLALYKGVPADIAAFFASMFFIGITIGRAVSGFMTIKLSDVQMIRLGQGLILLGIVILFLLICGCFMETTVIALILTPILLPVVQSVGVDPVVFGMIMMTTVTFGVMTPPVGTALYTCSDIMGCSIQETVKYGWPFYLAIVGVILFMVFFPDAVLFLPNLVYGAGG